MQVRRSNTILYCSNWAETVAFYGDVLELEMSLEKGWFVEYELGPESFVSIADAEHATVAAGRGAGVTLSWQVDDLEAARTTLVDRGVECTPIAERWGSNTTFCFDPAGNRIELWSQTIRQP